MSRVRRAACLASCGEVDGPLCGFLRGGLESSTMRKIFKNYMGTRCNTLDYSFLEASEWQEFRRRAVKAAHASFRGVDVPNSVGGVLSCAGECVHSNTPRATLSPRGTPHVLKHRLR